MPHPAIDVLLALSGSPVLVIHLAMWLSQCGSDSLVF